MANKLYPSAKEAFASCEIALPTDTIKVSLLTSAYTYSSAHDFYDDLSGVVATSTLSGKSVSDGVFDASDITWTAAALGSGSTITQMVIWKDTGTPGTSPLIAHIDNARGLPFTTASVDQPMEWDNGASKIFAI